MQPLVIIASQGLRRIKEAYTPVGGVINIRINNAFIVGGDDLILFDAEGLVNITLDNDGLMVFGFKRTEGRDKVYLGMIALKVLAGVEVRGVKPGDYWPLFRFVRDEALFYLKHGFKGHDPDAMARAIPLMTLFLLKLDRDWFAPKSKVGLYVMRLHRQWQLPN